ncbi:RNA exonuclease 5 [Cricetulus griseus]
MEQETEAVPRKRKEADSALATELGRPPWDLEDKQPKAKKARLSTILFPETCEVTHRQLCELLKYAVLGKSTVPKPSWCQLLHPNHLSSVVIFILKGMSQLHFYKFYLEFRFLRKTFKHKFSLPPPTSDFLFDIIGLQKKKSTRGFPRTIEGPLMSAVLKSSTNLQNDPIIQKYGCEKVGLTRCLLTKEEMKTFHFPLEVCTGGLKWHGQAEVAWADVLGWTGGSSSACGKGRLSRPGKVLEQARVEVPLFPFNIVQFSFKPFSPILAEEMKKRMKTKWTEMSTVYAGPFIKNCNIEAVKKMFNSLGPVESITLVLETYMPHFCIQYEVLEAAQLAIETMNGILVEDSYIRSSKLVTMPK